jgi:DNA polymerase-3 subunit epsilon
MRLILAYDSETTGLPIWKEPSEYPDQPHMTELSALLVDEDTREVLERMDVLIRPDGWVIPDDIVALNGITTEQALAEGIPEAEALDRFLALHAKVTSQRVAHNESFDARIMRIAIKRYLDDATADAFKAAPSFCTMWTAKPVCRMPQVGKGGIKLPTLSEAYKFFTGLDLVDAHRAGPDVEACLAVYYALTQPQAAQPVTATPPNPDGVVNVY